MKRTSNARTLSELQAQVRAISGSVDTLFTSHPPEVLSQRPAPESWSATECLVHLNISADAYFPVWKEALSGAPKTSPASAARYSLDFWGWVLAWTLEPPPRFRFPTPNTFQPMPSGPPATIVSEFLNRQRAIGDVLEQADGLALDRIRIVSPFDRRVRYSVWSSFCLVASHERRHIWQAARAVELITTRGMAR